MRATAQFGTSLGSRSRPANSDDTSTPENAVRGAFQAASAVAHRHESAFLRYLKVTAHADERVCVPPCLRDRICRGVRAFTDQRGSQGGDTSSSPAPGYYSLSASMAFLCSPSLRKTKATDTSAHPRKRALSENQNSHDETHRNHGEKDDADV